MECISVGVTPHILPIMQSIGQQSISPGFFHRRGSTCSQACVVPLCITGEAGMVGLQSELTTPFIVAEHPTEHQSTNNCKSATAGTVFTMELNTAVPGSSQMNQPQQASARARVHIG
jgi:hypothetical protein